MKANLLLQVCAAHSQTWAGLMRYFGKSPVSSLHRMSYVPPDVVRRSTLSVSGADVHRCLAFTLLLPAREDLLRKGPGRRRQLRGNFLLTEECR